MKILNITNFINEKIVIKPVDWDSYKSYDYYPESRDELDIIIDDIIKKKDTVVI